MKNSLKTFYFFIPLLVVFFFFSNNAKADIIFSQAVQNTGSNGSNTQIWTTATNFNSSSTVQFIQLWGGWNSTDGQTIGNNCGGVVYLNPGDFSGTYSGSFDIDIWPVNSISPVIVELGTPFPFSSETLKSISITYTGDCTSGGSHGYSPSFGHSSSDEITDASYTEGGDLSFILFDENTTFISGLGLSFSAQHFAQNMEVSDFSNWTLTGIFPSGLSYPMSVKYEVNFGTSTPTLWSNEPPVWTVPQSIPEAGEYIFVIPKTPTSTPGTYTAQGALRLYDDSLLAQTSILNYTISSGTITSYPPSINLEADLDIEQCPDTSFQLTGVDFGKGFCNLFRFLFMPSKFTTTQWTNLITDMQSKFPFAYFYDVSTAVNSASNPNGTSTPSITFTQGTNTPVHTFTINPSTALGTVAGSSNVSTLKTLIKYGLYFALGLYYFFRIRGIFNYH